MAKEKMIPIYQNDATISLSSCYAGRDFAIILITILDFLDVSFFVVPLAFLIWRGI